MKHVIKGIILIAAVALTAARGSAAAGGSWTLVGWNDLGMHCMDDSYEVFSILPPYNVIHAQLIDPTGARLTSPGGITVTFEAVPDPSGSINTTSAGKTNFWTYVGQLFGVSPPLDEGLTGTSMPGPGNVPQPMRWDSTMQWFTGEAIPLTPYDDAGNKNYYPMMKLVARDAGGVVLASTSIVLPVSDEMSCRSCHASGSGPAAMPKAGWVNDPDPVRDYRLNVLRIHDDRQLGDVTYQQALADAGYDANGLYATVTVDGTPVLCARCHGSNALPGTGMSGIPPLTRVVHSFHAHVTDPDTGMAMEAIANRTACYRCHPGSETRCLRGAMGRATNADASLAIQCQSCHGTMSMVGSAGREGWLEEPVCQSCHTGTATDNAGRIRYLSAFDTPGHVRQAPSTVFATNPDTPAAGLSLYRFSSGHGGLQCEACHGSTHAVFPTSHVNDNIQSLLLQGHEGTLAKCTTCHGVQPTSTNGGPHGMHPVGQQWVEDHKHAADGGGDGGDDAIVRAQGASNLAQCEACHGADLRGTVLSEALGPRTLSAFGTKSFWKGYRIGCYTCHNGPDDDHANANNPPSVQDVATATAAVTPVSVSLVANDADGDPLTVRLVSQPAHGRAGVSGTSATYVPDPGFAGTDTFTYAAWDGQADSNLGTVTVAVAAAPAPCGVSCSASVPASAVAGDSVQFSASSTSSGCTGPPAYAWSFGDGGSASTADATHTYAAAGTYTWSVTVTADQASCTKTGTITVTDGTPPPSPCTLTCSASAPEKARVGESATVSSSVKSTGDCTHDPAFSWSFGDGSSSTADNPSHTYVAAGKYHWSFQVSRDGATCSDTGEIRITGHRKIDREDHGAVAPRHVERDD